MAKRLNLNGSFKSKIVKIMILFFKHSEESVLADPADGQLDTI